MRSRLLIALLVVLGGAPAFGGVDPEIAPGLSGLVREARGPVEKAAVYAYRVADLSLTRATTGQDGRFMFSTLPAGAYKIIAHKPGFLPAIVLFTRATQMASDFLEFELVPEDQAVVDDDFWSIRSKIPGDVLREMRLAEAVEETERDIELAAARDFAIETEMMAGTDNLAQAGDSQLTRGRIGVAGQIGRVHLSLDGRFDELRPVSATTPATAGSTNAIGVSVEGAANSAISLDTVHHRLDVPNTGKVSPVDFETYRVKWSQRSHDGAQSAVSARYMAESGFNTQLALSPVGVPEASTALRLNGSHTQELTDHLSVRAGVEYQELRQDAGMLAALPGYDRQWVNAYGLGSMKLGDDMVVEYGLYSTLYDGNVSLSPHGSMVMDIGDHWQAETVVRQRVTDRPNEISNFNVAYYRDIGADASSEEHFYRLGLTHRFNDEERLRLRAAHREVSDTLRVFFNEDFFDQYASIYLVPGDELPELQMSLTQKLASDVYATIESSIGAGGGGLFKTANDGTFENKVRYLVTSMDTQFRRTETGVFVAFHRIEQDLEPVDRSSSLNGVDVDKLEVRLTQELGYFLDIGTDWAVLLDLELSRGSTPYAADLDESDIHRSIAGGVALRF